MNLARAASDRAMQDIDPPYLERPIPGSAATTIARLTDRARQRIPNNALVFARLSRAVRQTMALQAFLAAGYTPPRPRQPPDPDHAPPRAAADDATKTPANPGHHTDAPERPDWLPRLDPNSPTPIEDLIHTLGQDIDQAATSPPEDPEPTPEPTPEPQKASRHRPKRPNPARRAREHRRPTVQNHPDG